MLLDLPRHLDLAPVGDAIFFGRTGTVWPARIPGCYFFLALGGLVFPRPVFAWGNRGGATVAPLAGRCVARSEAFFKITWKLLIRRQFLAFVPGLAGPDAIAPTNNQVITGIAIVELVADALGGLAAGQEGEQ